MKSVVVEMQYNLPFGDEHFIFKNGVAFMEERSIQRIHSP